jgi:hypothetical protein
MNCGYQFEDVEIRKVSHDANEDVTSDAIWDGNPIKVYKVDDVIYREHRQNKTGKKSIRVDYVCPDAPYRMVSEWISPWSKSDWARNKAWEFFRDRGRKIHIDARDDISFYDAKTLLIYTDELKKPTSITVDYSGKYPRVKSYEWQEEENQEECGSGDTAGTDPLDGDLIPF